MSLKDSTSGWTRKLTNSGWIIIPLLATAGAGAAELWSGS